MLMRCSSICKCVLFTDKACTVNPVQVLLRRRAKMDGSPEANSRHFNQFRS